MGQDVFLGNQLWSWPHVSVWPATQDDHKHCVLSKTSLEKNTGCCMKQMGKKHCVLNETNGTKSTVCWMKQMEQKALCAEWNKWNKKHCVLNEANGTKSTVCWFGECEKETMGAGANFNTAVYGLCCLETKFQATRSGGPAFAGWAGAAGLAGTWKRNWNMAGIHLALLTMPHHPLVVTPAKQNAWHICSPECNAHAMAVLHGTVFVHSLALQAKKNCSMVDICDLEHMFEHLGAENEFKHYVAEPHGHGNWQLEMLWSTWC